MRGVCKNMECKENVESVRFVAKLLLVNCLSPRTKLTRRPSKANKNESIKTTKCNGHTYKNLIFPATNSLPEFSVGKRRSKEDEEGGMGGGGGGAEVEGGRGGGGGRRKSMMILKYSLNK